MELYKEIAKVHSKEDFIKFINLLIKILKRIKVSGKIKLWKAI